MYVGTPIKTIFYKGYYELHFWGVGKVNASVGMGTWGDEGSKDMP